MKLQNLIIVFLAIALPIIIVLSVYTGLQVKTASLKSQYDSYLIDAAHETLIAYQMNTKNDEKEYTTIQDTKIRNIEAALNVFPSSLATSFGATGSSKSNTMTYIPAVLLTLYDGYYIYTPTKTADNGTFSHELKPYVYYTKEYTKGSRIVTINYSLDNYVAVYYYTGNTYESRAGYLEIDGEIDISELDNNAKKYYQDAYAFTNWYNDIVVSMGLNNLKIQNGAKRNSALPGETSSFNDEKYEVIKNSITNNLSQAMYVYGRQTPQKFQMPELTGEDWDTVMNNVCLIAFMQGIPVGITEYNNYVIAISTENNDYVNEKSIYYINEGVPGGFYHRIWCTHLNKDNIKGYHKAKFDDKNSEVGKILACYYCSVRATNSSLEYAKKYNNEFHPAGYGIRERTNAYYTALANEKMKLSKLSDAISKSGQLTK